MGAGSTSVLPRSPPSRPPGRGRSFAFPCGENMIVGTAGHVDHGKTSLVHALTGVDTDRLAEEKARGISIELGFAYAQLGEVGDEPIGFIDVPGHRKFVQTMIAGAAGIDLGLLVVAADDGPMPQTREHVEILSWLGVKELVIALSKVDAVDDARRDEAIRETRALLDHTPFAAAPLVPVSVVAGEGLDALRQVLRARRTQHEAARDGARFRLAVDRAFVLQGIGLVVTGTCFAGRVAIGDALTLLPSRLEARVRSIHAQNEAVEHAHAGQRVALNLVGRGIEKSTVHRGDWVVDAALAIETDRADVLLLPIAGETSDALAARDWKSVRFHSAATAVNARITRLGEGGSLAQVAFGHPIHLVAGDRFVLRDAGGGEASGARSIGGGFVLDVDVPARGRRTPARLALLEVAATRDARATLAHVVATSEKGADLARFNVTHNTVLEADAVDAHAVGGNEPVLFSPERWDALKTRIVDALAAEHARVPDAVGPGRDRLRRMATPSLAASTFTALVEALKSTGRLAQTGAWLHLPEHRVTLSDADGARFDRIRGLLEATASPHNPPRVRDLAHELGEDEAAVRSVCVRLASLGELYKVAHDHYFLPSAVRALAAIAAELQAADGVAKAAAFRDRLGIGRKVAIQILEFFDRVGYTRRAGDEHRVIQPELFKA